MSGLNAEWPVVRIRDIGVLRGGGTPTRSRPDYFSGTIPWVTSQDIPEDYVGELNRAREYLTEQAIAESATRVVTPGSILVTTRVNVGKTAVTKAPTCFSQDVTAIELYSQSLALPMFVAFYLRARRASLLGKNQGSTISGITRESLAMEQIPLPPLSEQELIAQVLRESQAAKTSQTQADINIGKLRREIFYEMFLDHPDRKSWQLITIAEAAARRPGSIRTGPFGSDLLHSEFVDHGIPVLGIDNVVSNRFSWGERRYISPQKYDELIRFTVFPKDVLITIMGTVGRSCVAPEHLPTCISSKHLCVITLDETRLIPGYLSSAVLYDPQVRKQTLSSGTGTIMEGWNSGIIKGLRVFQPPLSLQQEFASRIQQVESIESLNDDARDKVEALYDAVLNAAFTGELTKDWRRVNNNVLIDEARRRDLALNELDAQHKIEMLPRTGRVSIPIDGLYSDLNKELRNLLITIKKRYGDGSRLRYFSAESLSHSLEGVLRSNAQSVEGQLSVLCARGLVIGLSREEQTEDTGEFIYGNAYRLPLTDRASAEDTEGVVGDYVRLRELTRLAKVLEREQMS